MHVAIFDVTGVERSIRFGPENNKKNVLLRGSKLNRRTPRADIAGETQNPKQSKILLATVLIMSQHHPIPLFNEKYRVGTIWKISARLQLRRGDSVFPTAFGNRWHIFSAISLEIHRPSTHHLFNSDVCCNKRLPSLFQPPLLQD